jgi:sporulation protein YlmC with PRC-barrel domain
VEGLELIVNLTDSLGHDVLDGGGESVGRLADLAVVLDDPYPSVTRLVLRGRRGARRDVPWSAVASFAQSHIELSEDEALPAENSADELLLAKEVLDHQIFDLAGKRLTRVGDVELALGGGLLRAVAVDVGASSILRRLGLRRLARLVRVQALDWRQLHLVSPRGHVLQLETTAASVHRLDASGLAELVGHLPPAREQALLDAVHPDKAAGAKAVLAKRSRRRRFDFLRMRGRAAT